MALLKFYNRSIEHRKQNEANHMNNVLSDAQRREQSIIDSIDRGVEEAQRRSDERIKTERTFREETKQNLAKELEMQLSAKRYKSALDQHEKSMLLIEKDDQVREPI